AAGVGHRMAGFGEPDPPERRCVAVLDDDEALADPVAQNVLCRPRHRAARLPAAQDHDARVTRLDVEVGPDERAHIAGREGGLPDRARVLARAHDESLRRRSPASRSTSSVFGKQNRIVEHPLRIPKDLARPGWPEAALECIPRQSTSTPNAPATPESRRRGDTILSHSLGLAFSHEFGIELQISSDRMRNSLANHSAYSARDVTRHTPRRIGASEEWAIR